MARIALPTRLITLLHVTGLALLARPAAAQPGTAVPPEVTVAQAALRAGDADSAIRTLEGFFQRNPQAMTGRLLLGNAYRQKGDLDKALAIYLTPNLPRPMRMQATYNAASVQAQRGNTGEALALLEKLKASGAFDMDLAKADTMFRGIRADPRFEAAMFAPGEFKNPFVEPVRVLHEWVGETKGDQFSWIARGIGDADGDKVSDVVTSAPTYGANGQPAGPGRVYAYSGKSGTLLWTQTGTGNESLGIGVEGAGDVNHDGIADVIAGAPGSSRAYVYSGRDGRLLLTLAPDSANEGFGGSVSGAGDQNGDGFADVVVGASGAGQGTGRAYLFSGKDGSRLRILEGEHPGDAFGTTVSGLKSGRQTPLVVSAPGAGAVHHGRVYVYQGAAPAARFTIESDSTGVALGGGFVSVVGDVNGDKVLDIYASDFPNAAKGASTGRVYVHSGADGHRLYTLTGEGPGDGFGIGSAEAGDVNRDGYDDLLIGAWQFSGVAPSGGKIYLYSGKDGTILRTITGRIPGETLGFDATGVGDVDGDGIPDLLVTSSWSNINGFRSGRMYLISGK
ncbi:MAG TPA: FG-GAP-like repeat-containing protein [Gemmatimonadales bacterium]|nr:FG-GAP-like repeat-containing protein [Gemmatimonadales bacterium]